MRSIAEVCRFLFGEPKAITVQRKTFESGNYLELNRVSEDGRLQQGDRVKLQFKKGDSIQERELLYVGMFKSAKGMHVFFSEEDQQRLFLSFNIISFEKTAEATKKSKKAVRKVALEPLL